MNLKKTLFFTIILALAPAISFAGQLYVVASKNLQGESFSAQEIKRILLGEISYIKNARVHLIYPSYASAEIETLSRFVGKGGSVRNLKSYWSKMIFTGKGTPPQTAENEEELKKLIERDNSIGISKSAEGLHVLYTINE